MNQTQAILFFLPLVNKDNIRKSLTEAFRYEHLGKASPPTVIGNGQIRGEKEDEKKRMQHTVLHCGEKPASQSGEKKVTKKIWKLLVTAISFNTVF